MDGNRLVQIQSNFDSNNSRWLHPNGSQSPLDLDRFCFCHFSRGRKRTIAIASICRANEIEQNDLTSAVVFSAMELLHPHTHTHTHTLDFWFRANNGAPKCTYAEHFKTRTKTKIVPCAPFRIACSLLMDCFIRCSKSTRLRNSQVAYGHAYMCTADTHTRARARKLHICAAQSASAIAIATKSKANAIEWWWNDKMANEKQTRS